MLSPMAGVETPPKVPYVELAARPRLALKLAIVGSGRRAAAGARDRRRTDPARLDLPGRGRRRAGLHRRADPAAPDRIIAPSYGVLIVLIGLAAALDGDTDDLVRAGLGWLASAGSTS